LTGAGDQPSLRENWRKLYLGLSKKQREACEQALKEFDRFVAGESEGIGGVELHFGARLAECPGPLDAMALVRRAVPSLSRMRSAEFLSSSLYPIVTPVGPNRRFLHRLGMIESDKARRPELQKFFIACNDLAHFATTPLPVLNILISTFTGVNRTSGMAVCTMRPRCERCPLTGYCTYFRLHKPGRARKRSLPIRLWNEDLRPREKMIKLGADNLNESELLALILRTGSGEMSALDLASGLMKRFGSLSGLDEAPLRDLQALHGIGRAKAVEIKAALTLGRRLMAESSPSENPITCSDDIFKRYGPKLDDKKEEYVYLLLLNSKNIVFKDHLVSKGSLTASVVHPRDALKAAVRESAHGVILVHNHPSGGPDPSNEDFLVTERMKNASEVLGIRFLDHIIIGKGNFYSFADMGQL
jgi:DNA repair protein RadC